jgi:hypothetical protein
VAVEQMQLLSVAGRLAARVMGLAVLVEMDYLVGRQNFDLDLVPLDLVLDLVTLVVLVVLVVLVNLGQD